MAAEIERRQGRSAIIPTQQKSDRGGARVFRSSASPMARRKAAVQIQQTEQLRGLTGGRFSLGEAALEQEVALRNRER